MYHDRKNKCNSKLINLSENEGNQKVEKEILLNKDLKDIKKVDSSFSR
jgi:hypothetical protein